MRSESSAPLDITASLARRIWLRAQRLDQATPFGAGPAATPAAIRHLGYVQIDTISVIERCHHHILFTRIPTYRRADLDQAQSVDKSVFEFWTHALAYLPSEDIRFFLGAMRRNRQAPGRWYETVGAAELRKVMTLIKTSGPLTIRDIDDDVLVEKDHPWASRKPSKRALQLAFHGGSVTVNARHGMLKSYDLMGRHFGWARRPRPASDRQVLDYLLDRALRSQGIVSLDSICYLDAGRKSAIQRTIAAAVRRKQLIPVRIEHSGATEYWVRPETLDDDYTPTTELVHILSPFDPLVIQRKRLQRFFDYAHRFEAYVPKEKRVLGYFALPVLIGDSVAAVLDLKTDREHRKLRIQQWTWIGRGGTRSGKRQIEQELHRFEKFQLA